MSQDNLIRMRCSVCKATNYFTTKNKKTIQKKLVMKKHCRKCRKHTEHKESKK